MIIAGARRYADDPNREQQYTKLPATWLNGDCWDDDPLPERTSTPGRGESIQLRNRAALQRAMVLDQRPTAWDLVPTVDELRERDRLARELEERSEG